MKQPKILAFVMAGGEGARLSPLTAYNSKPALTKYRVLAEVPGYAHVRLKLETGRTHQIRKHMAGEGYPVLGDGTYGAPGRVLRSKGLFLCAVELSFVHPVHGTRLVVKIDDPAKFTTFPDREERRWKKYMYHAGDM